MSGWRYLVVVLAATATAAANQNQDEQQEDHACTTRTEENGSHLHLKTAFLMLPMITNPATSKEAALNTFRSKLLQLHPSIRTQVETPER